MTGTELMAVIGFFVMLMGAISGVWWRIEGRVDRAKAEAVQKAAEAATEAASVRADLAAHKLHTAETYVTKAGMQEQTGQIMRAIEGVGNRLDGLNERLDRLYETQPRRTSARS
jgi:uncharacterized protein YpmB